jgi:hypothetical protein
VRTLPLTRGPPLPFLTTSTVCSDWLPAGLLRPAAGHGVHHVSALLARGALILRCRVTLTPCAGSPFPWRPTLRSFPLATSSALRHHSRYLLAVTAGSSSLRAGVATITRNALTRQPDLKVLFRCRVRCCDQVLPPGSGSMLPWACSPQSVCSLLSASPVPARGSDSRFSRTRGSRGNVACEKTVRAAGLGSWSARPPRRCELAEVRRPASPCFERVRWFRPRGLGRFQAPAEAVASLLPGVGRFQASAEAVAFLLPGVGCFQASAEAVAFLLPGLGCVTPPAEAGGGRLPGVGSLPGVSRSRCLSASRWALFLSTEVD